MSTPKDITSRVVIVSQHYPPDRSGNASRVHDTAKHLVTEGWEVTILAPPPAFPHGSFDRSWTWREQQDTDGVTAYRLWAWQPQQEDPGFVSRMTYYLFFPLHAFLWLLFNYREYDAIITSSPPIFTGLAALPFGLLTSTPWIVDVRDLWIDASIGLGFIAEGGIGERAARLYERIVLRNADRVTITTIILGDRLVELYDLKEDKIVHLPNGVNTSWFEPNDSNPEPVIVYTGNVGHAQDLESCIQAMTDLNHPEAVLKIVGDGDIKPDLEQLVEAKNLNEKVEFTSPVPREEIPRILDNAMIGIAPLKSTETLEYAVPTKAYEYMACGLPVIATGVGEIVDLIHDSGGGVIIQNDSEALAEQFRKFLQNPELREKYGHQGRQYVVSHYDRRRVAEKLSETVSELL